MLNSVTNMSLEIALTCSKIAIDKKAENLKILDLSNISTFTDYFVICSAMVNRQVQAISDAIESKLRQEGHKPRSIEGYNEGRWVLIDLGDVVVHIFMDAVRSHYDLDSLWCDAPKIAVPSEYYGPSATRIS